MGSRSGTSLFVFQQLTSCYSANSQKLKAGPAFSRIACMGKKKKKKSITLKNSRARGLLGQLTRTEIAWDQSLIKTVLVQVGAATALVKSSISSYRISSIRSRRRSIISWSSSSSSSVLWHLNCTPLKSGVKSVKLENLFLASNKRTDTSRSKTCTCLVSLTFPVWLQGTFSCQAFLYLCCRERVKHASTSLTHKQINLMRQEAA